MALTQLSDVFIKKVYLDTVAKNSTEKTAFVESGVVVKSPEFDRLASSGAQKVEVPVWNDLSSSAEPDYTNDDPEDLATPDKVDMSSFDARNGYLHKAWSSADLAAEIGGSVPDPMTRIKDRTSAYWNRQFQKRVLAIAKGIKAKNLASNNGDMVHKISQETTVGLSAANYISRDAVVEAIFTLGDAFDLLLAIALHSVVYQRLVNQQQIEFIQPAGNGVMIPTYLGKRVIVDDGLPAIAGTTSGVKYTTVLFGAKALAYGEGNPQVPVYMKREELQGNGGGVEILGERKTWLIHPFGHNFTNASVTGATPTLANLENAANWTRVFDRKSVPIAFLETNG